MSSKAKLLILLCCLTLSMSVSLPCRAQDATRHILIRKVVVKPGANVKFEEFVRKYKQAVKKTGAPDRWMASQSFVGGNNYNFVTPFTSWGAFARESNVLAQAYDDKEVKHLWELLQESVAKEKVINYTFNTDLSRVAPAGQQNVAVILYKFKLHMGKEQKFAEYVRKIKEATDATAPEDHWEMLDPGIGAKGPLIVIPIKAWTDLDKPNKPLQDRLTEHFGKKEGMRIFRQGEATIEKFSSSLHRVRLDLAFPPG